MKLTLNLNEDGDFRKAMKDLMESQVRSIVRSEVDSIVKAMVNEELTKKIKVEISPYVGHRLAVRIDQEANKIVAGVFAGINDPRDVITRIVTDLFESRFGKRDAA